MRANPRHFLQEADALLAQVGRGDIHDKNDRAAYLSLASHNLRLAAAALFRDDSEEVKARLALLRYQHQRLSALSGVGVPRLQSRLKDWTEPLALSPVQRDASFDLERALDRAAAEPGQPGAVFRVADEAVRAGWPSGESQRQAQADLDRVLRLAAVQGQSFRVVAASIVGGLLGDGMAADGILAALTTPAFRSGVDRGGLRVVYASLALLARPQGEERERAVAASDYLLRREQPGPDEIQFLSPAALQTRREPAEVLNLYAQWVEWYEENAATLEFVQAARNICVSLDEARYLPLDAVLHRIGRESRGEQLVRNLVGEDADALDLLPVDSRDRKASQCEAFPRQRVVRVTRAGVGLLDDRVAGGVPVGLPTESLVRTLGGMREARSAPVAAFTGKMRRGSRGAPG